MIIAPKNLLAEVFRASHRRGTLPVLLLSEGTCSLYRYASYYNKIVLQVQPCYDYKAMDKNNPSKTTSDNANAPGTFPEQAKQVDSITRIADAVAAGQTAATGGDPKSPISADPMNGGIPTDNAADTPTSVLELEVGGTGTILIHGILAEADYNPELSGRERTRVYDQMRKGDATCRLGLSAVKYPLLSASWFVKHGEGEDEEGPITTFVDEELMKNPNFSFVHFLRQALLFCDYGNSFHEKVFRTRADGKIGWKKFAPRLPKTVWRYTLQDGVTPGITQILPTGGYAEIPQWKLMMFVLDLEGSNYEGTSLLRACYQPWYYKTTYYKIDAIATERQGMGVPVIHVPPQATPEDKARAKVIAKNMRVNEAAYIDLPTGFTIEYIDTKAKELKAVKEMVLHHDRQILKAFLAHFLDMGATSAGSKNLSDDQSELFLVSLKYIAKIIQEQINIAIRELVDLNFSNVKQDQYPTLEVGGIGQVDYAQLAQSLQWLTQAGVVTSDEDLENYVRQTMDLPKKMALEDQDPKDLAIRQAALTNVDQNPSNGTGATKTATGKAPVKTSGKLANAETASSFIEGILTLQENIESAIEQQ